MKVGFSDPALGAPVVLRQLLEKVNVETGYADWTIEFPETSAEEVLAWMGWCPETPEECYEWPSAKHKELAQATLKRAFGMPRKETLAVPTGWVLEREMDPDVCEDWYYCYRPARKEHQIVFVEAPTAEKAIQLAWAEAARLGE